MLAFEAELAGFPRALIQALWDAMAAPPRTHTAPPTTRRTASSCRTSRLVPETIGLSGRRGPGTPVAIIQAQLGHGSPMLTLTKYGRFLPTASDRAKWEEAATSYDVLRRQAK